MKKSQPYYYEDVVFQLELNLQSIRRDLIKFLEEHQFNECLICNRLICCCLDDSTSTSLRSTTLSIASSADSAFHNDPDHTSMDTYFNAAPPPESLPIPKWPENKTSYDQGKPHTGKESPISIASLNIWVRASIPNVTQSTSRVSFPVPRKVLDHVNYSWPPFPKSIWSDERLKETTAREDLLSNGCDSDGNSSVDAFFKYFGGNRAIPKTAFAC